MKKINWWKILNAVLHISTLGIAKLQTIVENKSKAKAIELTKKQIEETKK